MSNKCGLTLVVVRGVRLCCTREDGHPGPCGIDHDAALAAVASIPDVICGDVCECGPNGEPLACGYKRGHDGAHSWSTLPTFVRGKGKV